jgi:predicted glycoside hydrolase/deacetylase ChbG (UPF0249 family)
LRILVSADVFGLSEEITTNILDAVDHGVVTSVSIIANGTGFDHATCEYHKRRGLYLTAHLNLMKGRPLCPADQLPDLVDEQGWLPPLVPVAVPAPSTRGQCPTSEIYRPPAPEIIAPREELPMDHEAA